MPSFSVVFDPALLTFSRDLTREQFTLRVKFLAAWARIARSGDMQIQLASEVQVAYPDGILPRT
jgi:hypothetical protein